MSFKRKRIAFYDILGGGRKWIYRFFRKGRVELGGIYYSDRKPLITDFVVLNQEFDYLVVTLEQNTMSMFDNMLQKMGVPSEKIVFINENDLVFHSLDEYKEIRFLLKHAYIRIIEKTTRANQIVNWILKGTGCRRISQLFVQPGRLKFRLNLGYIDFVDFVFETDFGGGYTGRITPKEMGISGERAHDYSGSPRDIIKALKRYKISKDDAIIDIGCGKGLAMWYMERFPFRKIAGIELSEDLLRKANSNLLKVSKHRARLSDKYCFICGDAGKYTGYDEYNFFYIYNSLPKVVMMELIENIIDSIRRVPRKIVILYLMPEHPETITESGCFTLIRKGNDNEIRNGMWEFTNQQ